MVAAKETFNERARLLRWSAMAASIGLCAAAGFISGWLFPPDAWYLALDKPFFNPPAWLFAPVWTLLYVAMGVAAWRIWCVPDSPERAQALRQFALQLALNAAWTPVFFGAHSLAGGFAVIVLLVFAIAVTIQRFHPLDKMSAWLLAPYLAWVAFATALNAAIWSLNGNQ